MWDERDSKEEGGGVLLLARPEKSWSREQVLVLKARKMTNGTAGKVIANIFIHSIQEKIIK